MNYLSTEVKPQTLDSREVAEMVGKQHNELLKDIRRYVNQFNEGNLPHVDFFQENTYTDTKGEARPCYTVTRKGCEFIANKLTGVKGTEFTAKYINKFHDMETVIQNQMPTGQNLIALAVIEAQKMLEQKDTIIAQQTQVIGELKPKADYTDRILQSKSLVNANQIAKDYGMSAKTFNKTLHNLGVQYSQGGQWLLYSKHQKKGYTSSETFEFERSDGTQDVNMRTKWTQKGRLFIYELLKTNGILPLIEQNDKAS